MKLIKKISLFSVLAIFGLSFFVSPIQAKENQVELIPEFDLPEGGEIVSIGEFNNYEIVSQENNKFVISFDLDNIGKMVTDIRYGLQLEKKVGEEYYQVDEKVFDEVFSLSTNQSISREIEYAAPDFLQGEFRLQLVSKDSSRLTLAVNSLGYVSLRGTGEYIQIINDCFFTIGTEDKSYPIYQTFSYGADKEVFLNCQLENMMQKDISSQVIFETYRRNTFNQDGKTTLNSSQDVSLLVNEKKEFKIGLPQIDEPQNYDIKVSLEKDGKKVSNSMVAHVIVEGESASILRARFDKEVYRKNDTVNLEVVTLSSINSSEAIDLEVEFKDDSGKSCADKLAQNISIEINNHNKTNIAIPIKNDCSEMKAFILLKSKEGKELDKKIIDLPFEGEQKIGKLEEKDMGLAKKIGWGIGIACLAASLIAFVIYRFKNEKNSTIGLFFLILFASLFCFSDAEATTWTYEYQHNKNGVSGNVNSSPNISAVDVGETIQLTSGGYVHIENDRSITVSFLTKSFSSVGGSSYTYLDGASCVFNGHIINPYKNSDSFKVPTVPGDYIFSITMTSLLYGKGCNDLKDKAGIGVWKPLRVYGCTGSIQSGGTMCSGDNSNLTSTVDWVNVSSCTSRKCEYTFSACGCGSANTQTYSSEPSDALKCSSGKTVNNASYNSSTNRWTWDCTGSSCTTTTGCYANKTPTNPTCSCGTATTGSYTSAPTSNLCSGSYSSSMTELSSSWRWYCNASSCAGRYCYADKPTTYTSCSCGSNGSRNEPYPVLPSDAAPASGLCSSPSTFVSNNMDERDTYWRWLCDASSCINSYCYANKPIVDALPSVTISASPTTTDPPGTQKTITWTAENATGGDCHTWRNEPTDPESYDDLSFNHSGVDNNQIDSPFSTKRYHVECWNSSGVPTDPNPYVDVVVIPAVGECGPDGNNSEIYDATETMDSVQCLSGTFSGSTAEPTPGNPTKWNCGSELCSACKRMVCADKSDFCEGQKIPDGCGGTCGTGTQTCAQNPTCCDGKWTEVKPN